MAVARRRAQATIMARTASTVRPVCEITVMDDHVRADVGPGHAGEIQKCYEDWACACLDGKCQRALLVGMSQGDEFAHLAARDAIASMAVAGMPAGFRLAVVARNVLLIAIYDAVVVAARRHGMDARRFQEEKEAVQWLQGGP
jgi:hypothetical protein